MLNLKMEKTLLLNLLNLPNNPKLTIVAIPELTNRIVDGSNCLILESSYNFVPTDICGQDLGSSTRPWRSLYVEEVFASSNIIYLGQTAIGSTNGELAINNQPMSTIITENLNSSESIIDLSSQVYIMNRTFLRILLIYPKIHMR